MTAIKGKPMATLTKATSGLLEGHVVAPINIVKFAAFKQACYNAHIPYSFGGKDKHPGSGKVSFPLGIDCSGFIRTLLMYSCEGAMDDMPDGSYTQGEWFASKDFLSVPPSDCANADGHIRVCVHHPDSLDETGHIWLTIGNKPVHTVESFGGHGPGERAWNARLRSGHTLNQLANLCFVLC